MLEREIREMAFIPRWSIVRTNRQQYLAEHTFFVAMYANDIGVYLGLDYEEMGALLQKALWHDMEEIFSGDIPGPCKRAGMGEQRRTWDRTLTRWLDKVFDRRPERDGSDPYAGLPAIDGKLDAIVKLADMIDECCEMGTESQMGNQTVGKLYRDSMQRVVQALEKLAPLCPTLGDGQAFTRLRGMVIDTCQRAMVGDSRNTSVFGQL